MDTAISEIFARQILDSRGNPTVEAEVILSDGTSAAAAVPSGVSTGTHEAAELRDGDLGSFDGRGVMKAVSIINDQLSDELFGMDAADQYAVDRRLIDLDGTSNKRNLGANTILAVSMAVCRAAAGSFGLPLYRYLGGAAARLLPVPMLNLLNGGRHTDNQVDIQEFMIMPVGFREYHSALAAACEIFYCLKDILKNRNLSTCCGDEGGFAPKLETNRQGLELLLSATQAAGYQPGTEIFFAIDAAASEFFKNGVYHFDGKECTASEIIETYSDWTSEFPLLSIEDGLAEDDWSSWRKMTEMLGSKIQLVGDDLFVTNTKRILRGIGENCANAVLIKPNQIGTVTETLDAVTLAVRNGMVPIISHRSGETDDSFIADLAVAANAGEIKTGSVSRGERTAKYNRLLRIEEELGTGGIYAGSEASSSDHWPGWNKR